MAQPAILGGKPEPLITDDSLSLLGPEERASLLQTLDACIARGGREADEVERFEARFAAKLGVAHAVAVCSATSGLQLALQAFGIGAGDDVLVPPYTFAATAHAIVHAGARPVFTDIDRETLCLDPEAAEERLTPRTRALMVVHIGGKPARMGPLLELARRHGLRVIEDAAQAHGATYDGRYAGTLGDAGVFSFSPKLMTSFRGGVVVTDGDETAERCRRLRFHGLPGHRNRVRQQRQLDAGQGPHFVHEEPGYSLAMTPIQAALLTPQLERLDERFALRHGNGRYLAEGLGRFPGLAPVLGCQEGRSNFYMLEVLYDASAFAGLRREDLVTALTWDGVPVSPTTVTRMMADENPSLRQYRDRPCPVACEVVDSLLVFGHPLQSLVLQGNRSLLDRILDRVEGIHQNASRIARHLATHTPA